MSFIIRFFSFKCFVNSLSLSSPCSQREKMSSMYLHHMYDLSFISLTISSSNSGINNILYGGVNFVSTAVPRFDFKVFALKVKILCLRTTSAIFTTVEVVTSFSCLKSSHLHKADKLSSCGMLGYKPTKSIVHKIISSGKFGKQRGFFRKSLISLT